MHGARLGWGAWALCLMAHAVGSAEAGPADPATSWIALGAGEMPPRDWMPGVRKGESPSVVACSSVGVVPVTERDRELLMAFERAQMLAMRDLAKLTSQDIDVSGRQSLEVRADGQRLRSQVTEEMLGMVGPMVVYSRAVISRTEGAPQGTQNSEACVRLGAGLSRAGAQARIPR
jgi:hypothetical protein